LEFFGDKMLCDINGALCRAYVIQRSTDTAAKRRLLTPWRTLALGLM
jgi:hypothetical protein